MTVPAEAENKRRQDEQAAIYTPSTEGAGETLFEVFIRHSTQKDILAQLLAQDMAQFAASKGKSVLQAADIGTSKGTLLGKMKGNLLQSGFLGTVMWDLVEPDDNSYRELVSRAGAFVDMGLGHFQFRTHKQKWEEFFTSERALPNYDYVTAIHVLYHLDDLELRDACQYTLEKLAPGGRFLLGARQIDKVYELIREFNEEVTGNEFNPKHAFEAVPILSKLTQGDKRFKMYGREVNAKLRLPFKTNIVDTTKVLAFIFGVTVDKFNEDSTRLARIYSFLKAESQDQQVGWEDIELDQTDLLIIIQRRNGEAFQNGETQTLIA